MAGILSQTPRDLPFKRRRRLTYLRRRYALFMGGNVLAIVAAAVLALAVSVTDAAPFALKPMAYVIGLAIAVKVPVFVWRRLHHTSWRHVSIHDLLAITQAVVAGSGIFALASALIPSPVALPHLYVLVPADFVLTFFLLSAFHVAPRAFDEAFRTKSQKGARVLLVGAGSAGEQLVRAMRADLTHTYTPVGFIDDDPDKLGTKIHGIPVLGDRDDIPEVVKKHRVKELLVAMPSADGSIIREIVRVAREADVSPIRTVPALVDLFTYRLNLSQLQDLQPEDLLRRPQVQINTGEIAEHLRGSVVLVTGAGGSIGSELCRQIARFDPKRLVMLEQDETALFDIGRQLSAQENPIDFVPVIGDIRNLDKVERVMDAWRPQVIFHAAAYKHVPLMEQNPADAVLNNVLGTRTVAEASLRYGAERFVLISTDKAVNPTSVMGATKRIAEMVCRELNALGDTKFMAVRFGNVLGSRGSVIPIFKEQIKAGGPITVTDPEMRRYFMTAAEAVSLVLQAAAMGKGSEVFVLDMGEPHKILDLATDMVRMAGLEPDIDIPIHFTGMRPGEKLFEDILTAEEGTEATRHDKIFVANMQPIPARAYSPEQIGELEATAATDDREAITASLRLLLPNYTPDQTPAPKREARAPAP